MKRKSHIHEVEESFSCKKSISCSSHGTKRSRSTQSAKKKKKKKENLPNLILQILRKQKFGTETPHYPQIIFDSSLSGLCALQFELLEDADFSFILTLCFRSGDWRADDFNFQNQLHKLHGVGFSVFFNAWVGEDEKNVSRNVLQVRGQSSAINSEPPLTKLYQILFEMLETIRTNRVCKLSTACNSVPIQFTGDQNISETEILISKKRFCFLFFAKIDSLGF